MLKKKALLLQTLVLITISADAVAEIVETNVSSVPLGRAQISATEANANLAIVGGDLMQPLALNQDNYLYGDLAGDYASDDTYLMSPGIGYRGIFNNQIFGTYAFSDYERTNLGENFWVLSPGVEWISPQWDAHVNLYFPTNKSQKDDGVVFADTLGNYDGVTFEENTTNQYDMLVQPYAVIGNGADAEIGYSFAGENNLKSRVYLGSYYYQPPGDTENILGETVGYQQAFTQNLSFTLSNSYDEVNHYALCIGLTLTFGGNSNEYSTNVHDRLLDPVERHIGIIDTGAGTYDQQTTENRGMALQYDNVHFVSENPTGNGDTTYGNSGDLSQETIDEIYAEDPNGARIYIQGGPNAIYTVNGDNTGTSEYGDGLIVYNEQDFYGQTTDYKAPASSNERPQIQVADSYNGFIVQNNQENTFSNLYISSIGSSNNTGILVSNTSTNDTEVNIDNTTITQFSTGVSATNSGAGNLTMNATSSQFNDNSASENNAYGMNVTNNGSGDVMVNATDSEFNNNTATIGSGNHLATGLSVTNTSSGNLTVNATNSQFNNNSASGSAAVGVGVNMTNDGTGTLTMNASESTFNGNAATGSDGPMAFGVYALNTGAGDLTINATNSFFNENTAGNSGSYAYGMDAVNTNSGNLTITASDSEFNNNSATDENSIYAGGLNASNNGSGDLTIDASDSQFNNNSSNYAAFGMSVYNGNGGGNVTISATNSEFNSNSRGGLYVENASTSSESTLVVTSLFGSSFDNNARYGIYGFADNSGTTTINYTGTTFSENGIAPVGSNGNVTFIPSTP